MKRFLALTAILALSLSAVACGADNDNNATDTVDSTTYKVGVGSYTTTKDSSSSIEGENGKGVVSTTYATVIFDENDIIKKVYIDEVQSKIYFDGQGRLDESKNNGEIRSKRELGDEYGMKPASDIGKEWYEQINSLEDYLVGKNIREIGDYVMNNGYYGTENNNADNMGSAENNTGNDTGNSTENNSGNTSDGIMNGAKNIADGIMNGARNIMGRNGSSSDTDSTNTAEGITNNTDSSVADGTNDYNSGGNPATSDENYINNNNGADSSMNSNSGTGNNTGNNSAGSINWEEDLKSSVTIDLTNIQRALQKAYENAR